MAPSGQSDFLHGSRRLPEHVFRLRSGELPGVLRSGLRRSSLREHVTGDWQLGMARAQQSAGTLSASLLSSESMTQWEDCRGHAFFTERPQRD
ncbi:uncharacterized protein AAES06_007324 isoform 1-T2 [Glossophaga mutica]